MVNNLPAGRGAEIPTFWQWLQGEHPSDEVRAAAACAPRARAQPVPTRFRPAPQQQLAAMAGTVAEEAENALHTGFQTASSAGPVCEEPMWAVVFLVEAVENSPLVGAEGEGGDASGPLARGGEFIACAKDAFRLVCQRASPRLAEAMLHCQLQCSMDQLGSMHGVIARRRGQVTREDLWEGTYVFTVECLLPVRADRRGGGCRPRPLTADPGRRRRWPRASASPRSCA